jgi:hypothetical protein
MTTSPFDMERPRVALLMQRLGIAVEKYEAPNTKASGESGADVIVVSKGRRIGIQVTDLDTGKEPGRARAAETRLKREAASRGGVYGTWAQNNPGEVVAAIDRSVSRKALMSFAGFEEFWLLLCCGVPELGAVGATFVMTPCLNIDALNNCTLDKLSASKYTCAFIHTISGAEEQALYQWTRGGRWSKTVLPRSLEEQGRDFWEYGNEQELVNNLEGWCRREIEKILGKKIDLKPQALYSDKGHIVNWIDRATGETMKFPANGTPLCVNERHAMIFACSVIKSQPLDVWVADENGVGVADRKKIADFANANGYL